jgi:hypothetical protein
MGVSTTEMNSNMWSVLTNSKSADFIDSEVETTDMYWSEYTTFSGNFVLFY